jgi:hypothetical protein
MRLTPQGSLVFKALLTILGYIMRCGAELINAPLITRLVVVSCWSRSRCAIISAMPRAIISSQPRTTAKGRTLRFNRGPANGRNRRVGDTARPEDDARVSTPCWTLGDLAEPTKSAVPGAAISRPDIVDHCRGVPWHEIRLRTSASNDRFGGFTGRRLGLRIESQPLP